MQRLASRAARRGMRAREDMRARTRPLDRVLSAGAPATRGSAPLLLLLLAWK